jgi:hypothetical protein
MQVLDNLRYFNEWYVRAMRMNHAELYTALGLDPKRHLPDSGLPAQKVGNVMVWVEPRDRTRNQDAKRVWCMCPHCFKVLTAGKFHQHARVHNVKV